MLMQRFALTYCLLRLLYCSLNKIAKTSFDFGGISMKRKYALIALVLVLSLVLLLASYVVFHMTCGNAHLVKHIRLGMTMHEVEDLLGEPYGQTNGNGDWVYHLADGSELWIHFSPEDPDIMHSEYTVHGYSYYEKGSGDVWFNICATLLVCAVCFGAAFLIRRILNRPKITLKGVRQWFISNKRKLSYIALVLMISIAVLCIASIIFHLNCGTAHLVKHIRYGMSYDKVEKLLGERAGGAISCGKMSPKYDLDDGTSIYLTPSATYHRYPFPDFSTVLDESTVCGFRYMNLMPEPEIGLYIGAALLVCLIGGIDAFLIRRKWKQPD